MSGKPSCKQQQQQEQQQQECIGDCMSRCRPTAEYSPHVM
jgi:hypothetical protein